MRDKLVIMAGISLGLGASLLTFGQVRPTSSSVGIEVFNGKLENATRRMDTAAVVALWADDGVSLLPSTKPIVGKPEIEAFLTRVTESLQGAKMESFELRCSAPIVSGDLGSEWCDEHQIVKMPGGKAAFDGRGRMLLVLRRARDGEWQIEREMWNQAEAKK